MNSSQRCEQILIYLCKNKKQENSYAKMDSDEKDACIFKSMIEILTVFSANAITNERIINFNAAMYNVGNSSDCGKKGYPRIFKTLFRFYTGNIYQYSGFSSKDACSEKEFLTLHLRDYETLLQIKAAENTLISILSVCCKKDSTANVDVRNIDNFFSYINALNEKMKYVKVAAKAEKISVGIRDEIKNSYEYFCEVVGMSVRRLNDCSGSENFKNIIEVLCSLSDKLLNLAYLNEIVITIYNSGVRTATDQKKSCHEKFFNETLKDFKIYFIKKLDVIIEIITRETKNKYIFHSDARKIYINARDIIFYTLAKITELANISDNVFVATVPQNNHSKAGSDLIKNVLNLATLYHKNRYKDPEFIVSELRKSASIKSVNSILHNCDCINNFGAFISSGLSYTKNSFIDMFANNAKDWQYNNNSLRPLLKHKNATIKLFYKNPTYSEEKLKKIIKKDIEKNNNVYNIFAQVLS